MRPGLLPIGRIPFREPPCAGTQVGEGIALLLMQFTDYRSFFWPSSLFRANSNPMRPDGTILDRPGYDSETSLFFDPGPVTFPEIPSAPTKEDARRALHQLHDVIREFTFVDKAAKAVALSGLITVLVRRSLRTAPLLIFDAPVMASGKTLLAEIMGITATGRTLPAMSYTGDEGEERKRITAALACGDPAILVDNVSHPLKGDALCAVLTQELWKDRILGVSWARRSQMGVTLSLGFGDAPGAPVQIDFHHARIMAQGCTGTRSAAVEKEKPPDLRDDRGLQVTLANRTREWGMGGKSSSIWGAAEAFAALAAADHRSQLSNRLGRKLSRMVQNCHSSFLPFMGK